MSERNQLRIVVQGMGLYTAVISLMRVTEGVARFVTYRFFSDRKTDYGFVDVFEGMKTIVLEPVISAALLLLVAWLLLAKTDWFVKAIMDMSRRSAAPTPAE